jgi:hypothetical protein
MMRLAAESAQQLFIGDSCNDGGSQGGRRYLCSGPYGYNHGRSIAEGKPARVLNN